MSKNVSIRLLGIALLAGVLIVAGCNSGDDPATPTTPQSNAPQFTGPEAYAAPAALLNSQDPHATQAVMMVSQVGIVSLYAGYLNGPGKDAEDGPPWNEVWTIPQMGLSIDVTIDEDGDDWTWVARMTGTIGGVVYEDDLVYRAREAKAGGRGRLDYLDAETGSLLSRWGWDGAVNTLLAYEGEAIASEIVVTPDGQGGATLESYAGGDAESGLLVMSATWDAHGVGNWSEFDQTGSLTSQGDF